MIITIDGPVASGKSSVAKELAKRLNIYYLYTGLLYRAVAYILTQKLNRTESNFFPLTQEQLKLIISFEYLYENNDLKIIFENIDITNFLYNAKLSQVTSIISANKQIRETLLNFQRSVAKSNDVIAEGRDCGTVVFPSAGYKFFLMANEDVRVKRLMKDKRRKETRCFDEVKKELLTRDERDKSRKFSPLVIPNNAIIIDNSNKTFQETVDNFLRFIE